MRKSLKTSGFTLVEILVALFIFTLIALIMTQALHHIFKIVSATERAAQRLAQMQMAMVLLDRDLQQYIDRPITNNKGAMELSFIGNSNEIKFTHGGQKNPAGQELRSTLQRSAYSLKDGHFIRDDWDVLDQLPKTNSQQRTLLDHLDKLTFAFLDIDNNWRSSWPPPAQGKNLILRAVRVNMSFSDWGELSYVFLLNGTPLNA